MMIDACNGERVSGTRPITLEANVNCGECHSVHDIEICPKCGNFIEYGYGLAYGGLGSYMYCQGIESGCDWHYFESDEDYEEEEAIN